MAIDKRQLDMLVSARRDLKDKTDALADAIKAISKKYGVQPASLRAYINACAKDDGVEELTGKIDEITGIINGEVAIQQDWIDQNPEAAMRQPAH